MKTNILDQNGNFSKGNVGCIIVMGEVSTLIQHVYFITDNILWSFYVSTVNILHMGPLNHPWLYLRLISRADKVKRVAYSFLMD